MNMLDYEKRKSEYIQKEAGLTQAEADKYFPLNNELTQKKFELHAKHREKLREIRENNNISDEEIVSLNLPTAVPYVFEFDDEMNLQNDYFLGDPEEIRKLMEAVANQAKAK